MICCEPTQRVGIHYSASSYDNSTALLFGYPPPTHAVYPVSVQIRDPPSDGVFAHGLYLWGIEWEKNAALEITDTHPKQTLPSPLPALQVTAVHTTQESTAAAKEATKGPFPFNAPCYLHTTSPRVSPVLDVCFISNDIPASRWPIRGVICYLRPF